MSKKPALLGGAPLLAEKWPPSNTIGEEEKKAVSRVLDTGVLSGFVAVTGESFYGGPDVLKIEKMFCDKFKSRHAVALSSATTALNTAVQAAGIGAGDEVIVPPYTMSATATAVLLAGGIPVFADIDERTFNIDPREVKRKITPRTKAIIAVNLFGQPAELDTLSSIAKEHRLMLIEDNAQAPLAKYGGKFAGTIGDMGVFSLNRHKTMQCGEGGILVTDDKRLAKRAMLVRNHGEVVVDMLPKEEQEGNDDLLGNNYRMTEPLAAIGIEQLKKLDFLTEKRVALADHLTEQLKPFPFLAPPYLHPKATHVYYNYCMKFDERKAGMPRELFVKAMQAENLPIGMGYVKPIYLYPFYQRLQRQSEAKEGERRGCPFLCPCHYDGKVDYRKGLCPVTERMHFKELCSTDICRWPLTKKDIDLFVEGIGKVVDAKDDLLAGK